MPNTAQAMPWYQRPAGSGLRQAKSGALFAQSAAEHSNPALPRKQPGDYTDRGNINPSIFWPGMHKAVGLVVAQTGEAMSGFAPRTLS
jgi:hypothetical protein